MTSSDDKLTPLQRALLDAFFACERRFFLTGGAALAGFYLRHRRTTDLDLFTLDAEAFEHGRRAVEAATRALGADVVVRQHAPGFLRLVVTRGDETVVVDLVLERAPQARAAKSTIGSIVVDVPEDILANKLTALLSRAEERDLVDVWYLERSGFRVEDALEAARAKDGGCTPAALAWVLSEVSIPDDARIPGDVSVDELRRFLADVIVRLRRSAAPDRRA
jgi:predicted nucleotidyltransferase component of viral defense system